MAWRKLWDADNLDDFEIPEILKPYLPYGLSGYDKDGAPGKISFVTVSYIVSLRLVKLRIALTVYSVILKRYINQYLIL